MLGETVKWLKCVCLRRRGGGGAGCGKEEVQVTATSMTALVETLARRGPWKGRADFGDPSVWWTEVTEHELSSQTPLSSPGICTVEGVTLPTSKVAAKIK